MKKLACLQKSISALVIISILAMPFSFLLSAQKVEAQSFGAGSGIISGLAPAIAQLPLCKNQISNGIKKLFGGVDKMTIDQNGGANPIAGEGAASTDTTGGSSIINNVTNTTGGDGGNTLQSITNSTAINIQNNTTLGNGIGGSVDIAYPDSSDQLAQTDWESGLGTGTSYTAPASTDASTTTMDSTDLSPVMSNDTSGAQTDISGNLNEKQTNYSTQVQSVPTNDAQLNSSVNTLLNTTTNIKTTTQALQTNDSCLKSIGRLIIKKLLQDLTKSTVNWINSGFQGNPSFVQDPGKFFGDIAKNEIFQMSIDLKDPKLFPFGKSFLLGVAANYNNKFQKNATYSLDKMIKDTNPKNSAIAFSTNFSMGGWGAWDAMTQIPANNPLGFQLMASNELSQRLQGTFQSTAQNVRDTLQQANGYLGDTRCVDASGNANSITLAQKNKALGSRQPDPCTAGGGHWAYVTPGQMMAAAATTAVNYQSNQLLSAQDLNDAIAAIIDALLAKFSSTLYNKGLNALAGTMNGTNATQTIDITGGTTDFNQNQINSSTWLQQNPDFNIRTDLNQALIDIQRTYIEKLQDQNNALLHPVALPDPSVTEQNYTQGGDTVSGYDGLIPTIYQLDYCIPGPNPNWQDDAQQKLQTIEAQAVNAKKLGFFNSKVANDLSSVLDPTGIVGNIVGGLTNGFIGLSHDVFGGKKSYTCNDGAKQDQASADADQYKQFFYTLTGGDNIINIGSEKDGTGLCGGLGSYFNPLLDALMTGLTTTINNHYNDLSKMPTATSESGTEFTKIAGYNQMIADNKTEIATMQGVVKKLQTIKDAVDVLNKALATKIAADIAANTKTDSDETTYETSLQEYIDDFALISNQLVSGDDVASVDKISQQILYEQTHVMDLIKNPSYGCEAELKNQTNSDIFKDHLSDWNDFRAPYPQPHLYDYDKKMDDTGETLTEYLKTTKQQDYGFLMSVGFGNSVGSTSCSGVIDDQQNSGSCSGNASIWENVLGIY